MISMHARRNFETKVLMDDMMGWREASSSKL